MKLENFNEAFERMGATPLTEADNTQKKEIVKDRFEKLSKLKDLTVKSIQSVDLNDLEKFRNYVTVLDWIRRLVQAFKDNANDDDRKFANKVKWADHYIGQIADAVSKGQLVHESLLKESLNYIDK